MRFSEQLHSHSEGICKASRLCESVSDSLSYLMSLSCIHSEGRHVSWSFVSATACHYLEPDQSSVEWDYSCTQDCSECSL